MGFDKLLTFFNKNMSNISEELFDIPQVVANHIYIDMNFLVYNSISNLEEEINRIIMIICGVSFTDIDVINAELKKIFDQLHWTKLDICMNDILDGSKISEIILKFKETVNNNMIELLGWHIYNMVNHHIVTTHMIQFIKSINMFFDGIPNYSKILEQRRRRIKNYIDSKNRKSIFKTYFKNMINTIITEDSITFDYFDWVSNMYSFDKSLGPYSQLLIYLSNFIENKMCEAYTNIKIYINNSTIYGEADYKIFCHIKDNNVNNNIAIHSCDSDFIFLVIWYQLTTTKNIDINILLINYSNSDNIYNKHLYSSKKIISNLIEKYTHINNMNEDASINIVFDFLCLLILFGNDIMPTSY